MQADETTRRAPEEFGPRFARMAAVVRMTGLCRATIYRMIAEKRFPAQVRIGTRAVGWRWSDLERWSDDRGRPTH
ncbi:MAG: AlpA family phage regulatory protein [Burkholderiaceae bacterium]